MGNDINYNSSVKVKFNFKEKAGSNYWPDIRKRLDLQRESLMDIPPVQRYLNNISNSENSIQIGMTYAREINFAVFSGRQDPNKYADYVIKLNPKKLTLEVKGNSKQDIKIGEFFDVKALENFVLTGKMPRKQK